MNKTDLKKERLLILFLLLIVVIVAIIYFRGKGKKTNNEEVEENKEKYVQILEDGTKLNISNKLAETKKVDGFEISNIQLTNKDGISVLLADVKNNTGRDSDIVGITITLLDDAGKTIDDVAGIVSPMKNGETTQLNAGITMDYANAYDFKVKINK